MRTGRPGRLAVLIAGLAAAGCVERRFVIESNVPSAQVYIDNRPIGPAPAHTPFEYYGYYTITLVQPGYETQSRRVHVVAPWYAYPPFDFLVEVLWPFHVQDNRRYYFELCPAKQTRTDDILVAADALRLRAWQLPVPPPPKNAPPGPVLEAPVAPQTGPQPGPPGAIPLPAPTPLPGPTPPPQDPLVPSVLPSGYQSLPYPAPQR